VRKVRVRKEPSFAVAADAHLDVPAAPFGRRDLIAAGVLLIVGCGIAGNALFLQKGPHPSPFFHARPQPRLAAAPPPANPLVPTIVTPPPAADSAVTLPRPRPPELAPAQPPAPVAPSLRSQIDVVIDIQRELSKRGFYDGVADGVYGPKTDAAIRDFEQAAGLKPVGQPNEAFLAVLSKSQVKFAPKADIPRPPDPIAEIIAPTKKITAVQRALSDYGYGQIRVTGTLDRETKEAIEQFERARKLPVTGQVSPRLMRELSSLTGRPLE
jgi:peptidoglycan hydrolase-like protein with peptidoglycan-binding domain